MKNFLFSVFAIVLFSFNGNANESTFITGNDEKKQVENVETVQRTRIIKYLIAAAISWFGDDSPSHVNATGAYKNGGCDARNANVCQITFRISNTKVLDIKDLYTNSTVLETPLMKRVINNDITFLSFDDNGKVYLTASEKTNNKLFTSGEIKQENIANIDEELIKFINNELLIINPKASLFKGFYAGMMLKPVKGGDGFIYIALN